MYDTDQEQIEAIKRWWSQNANWVIGAIVLFFASYVGYNWYVSSTEQHRLEASAAYEQLLETVTAEQGNSEEQERLTRVLKTDYSDLSYASMAALLAAESAVESEDYDAALTELNWAAENAESALLPVIHYRTAMVQYQLDQLDAALATLNKIKGEGHQALTFELKGDILLAQGKTDDARSAYQAALDLSSEQSINNPYLKIKLDDLAVAE